MCKYCKLKTLNEYAGEKSNESKRIGALKDGSQLFELCLSRYIVEEDDIHRSELILDLAFELNNGLYNVKTKYIPIKYCPFCGEEL